MSTDQMTSTPEGTATATSGGDGAASGFWASRSSLIMAGLVLALSVYLTVGITAMEVPSGADVPGPRFFPIIIAVCGYVLGLLLAVQALRSPEPAEDTEAEARARHRTRSDWRTLGLVLAAFLAFTLLLNPLGWILAAALMFWLISYALGSSRPLFDIALAVVFSAAVQVAFSAGLGLNLPSGLFEGVL